MSPKKQRIMLESKAHIQWLGDLIFLQIDMRNVTHYIFP